MDKTSEKKWFPLICVILAIVTFAAFEQVCHNDFTNYDDDIYVTKNQNVQAGLTFSSIEWAFVDHDDNWHPLTWLSHMLDCQLFGLNPSYHHLTNLLLHIANTLLLFAVLNAMTAALWQSAFVAAAFALHPLHVQSVAWVSERKDVLSTLFWMLTMAAYLRYVRGPTTTGRYLLVLLAFALGLMAKPMLVTLPFVLLLLDYWPLNRLENISFTQASSRQTLYRLVREKIPLFVLSAISSVITFFAQRSGESVVKLVNFPMHFRLTNAAFSYTKYINKTFWPKDLSAFYPCNENELTTGWVLVVLAFLLVASIRVIRLAPNYKYLFVGWFWFMGTLVPVIGIVQVGSQALADRYTYVPLIGLFIIIAWGFNDLLAKAPYRKVMLGGLAFAVLLAAAIWTRVQVRYWQNSITLWEHALQVTSGSPAVHDNLASALGQQGRFNEALEHYQTALKLLRSPDADMLYNMGSTYSNLGRYAEAIDAFEQAVKANPNCADAYVGLGNTFGKLGRHADAVEACKQAIKIKPYFAEAYCNLGAAYVNQGHLTDAIDALERAIYVKPDYAQAHYNLGQAFLQAGDKNSALEQQEILKQLNPDMANALLSSIRK